MKPTYLELEIKIAQLEDKVEQLEAQLDELPKPRMVGIGF